MDTLAGPTAIGATQTLSTAAPPQGPAGAAPQPSPSGTQAKQSSSTGDEIALAGSGLLLGAGVTALGAYALSKRNPVKSVIAPPQSPPDAVALARSDAKPGEGYPTFRQEPGDDHCGYYAALTMTKGHALRHPAWDGTLRRYTGMMQQYARHVPTGIQNLQALSSAERGKLLERENLRPCEIGELHNAIVSEVDSKHAAEDLHYVPVGTRIYAHAEGRFEAYDFDGLAVPVRDRAHLERILERRVSIPERCTFNDEAFTIEGTPGRTVPTFTVTTLRARPASDARPPAESAAHADVDQKALPKSFEPSEGEAYDVAFAHRTTEAHGVGHAIPVTYEDGAWYARDPVKHKLDRVRLVKGEHSPETARKAVLELLYGTGNRVAEMGIGAGDVVRLNLITPRLRERPVYPEHHLVPLPAGADPVAQRFYVRG